MGRVEPDSQEAFLESIEKHLNAINIEYKAKRESQRLADPVLHVMKEGWYERGRRQQVESGMRAFQAKTQVLSPEKLMTQKIQPEIEAVIKLKNAG